MKKNLDFATTVLSVTRTALTRLSILFLFLPSLIFLIATVLMYSITVGIKEETVQMRLAERSFTTFIPSEYPVLSKDIQTTLFGYRTTSTLSAQSAIIMDNDSKIILFSKNKDIRFSMASTVKIMTALVALEHFQDDDILTIQSLDAPPAIVGYGLGEKVKFIDMLYGLLLTSGNDAALAIAQNYPGGQDAFIQQMNQKAKELHLNNTHFSDSSGLDDTGNYTTVVDLAHVTSVALENPTLKKIVATKNKVIVSNTGKEYRLTNLNQLLGLYGVNGMKTGFTPDAGGMLVTTSQQNGHTLVYIVMKSEDRFGDTEKLLSATYKQVLYTPLTLQ